MVPLHRYKLISPLASLWLLALVVALGLFLALEYLTAKKLDKVKVVTDEFMVLNPGETQLPGFILGKTPVGQLIKDEMPMEFALIVGTDGSFGLEAILFSDQPPYLGTLILVLGMDEDQAEALLHYRTDTQTLGGGHQRYRLPREAIPQLVAAPVLEMVWLPQVRLRAGLWRKLWGTPDAVMEWDQRQRYWLYPEKGLIISVVANNRVQWLHFVPLKRWNLMLERINADFH